MNRSAASPSPASSRRLVVGILLGGLFLLGGAVVAPFLVPLAWAAVLAYVTWPAYIRLVQLLRGRRSGAALLMVLAAAAALVLPLAWLGAMLHDEVSAANQAVADWLANPPSLPDFVRNLPLVGPWLDSLRARWLANPSGVQGELAVHAKRALEMGGKLMGGVGRNAAKLGIALLSLFFFYRDGEGLLRQVSVVFVRYLGERGTHYLDAVGATTRAVVLSLVLSALAQGTLAGLGYWVAGVASPFTLAVLTAVVAFIPFGTPIVWGSVAVWLLLTGHLWAGAGLFLWGALLVSWVDNVIRPLVVSAWVRLPFLLVFFGVLGGLAAFGLIGLFLGPVVLAVLTSLWREWVEEQSGVQAS